MYRLALAALALFLLSAVTNAQLLQLGPAGGVRINAPFVRVEVGPSGETFVRAPFTSVYAPGRRYIRPPVAYSSLARPVYEMEPMVPVDPVSRSIAPRLDWEQMSWRVRRQHVRDACRRLIVELDHMRDGEVWRDYLKPDLALQLVAEDSDRAPDRIVRDQFLLLSQTFEATVANRQLSRITQLPGFQTMRDGLYSFASTPTVGAPPTARSADAAMSVQDPLRRQLADSAARLDRELQQLKAAATFRSYLELPLDVYAGAGRVGPGARDNQPDLAQLELMLGRYDRVNNVPEYREIVALESFRSTRRWLSEYVTSLQDGSSDEPEPTPAELLPLPLPEPESR